MTLRRPCTIRSLHLVSASLVRTRVQGWACLDDPSLSQVDIDPSGEAVLAVPRGLAMAHEDQLPGSAAHRRHCQRHRRRASPADQSHHQQHFSLLEVPDGPSLLIEFNDRWNAMRRQRRPQLEPRPEGHLRCPLSLSAPLWRARVHSMRSSRATASASSTASPLSSRQLSTHATRPRWRCSAALLAERGGYARHGRGLRHVSTPDAPRSRSPA